MLIQAAAIFALGVPGIPESVELIAAAYIAVLAAILIYVAIMAARLLHAQRELSELRRLVDERRTVAEAVCGELASAPAAAEARPGDDPHAREQAVGS